LAQARPLCTVTRNGQKMDLS